MNSFILLVLLSAPEFNINPDIAITVMKQESSLRPKAVGPVGEIGLFQVRPKYSKFSRKELFNPIVNITEGLRMLSFAKKYCKHKVDYTWLVCYNAGVTGGSKVTNPKEFEYYKKVMGRLK